MCRAAEKAEENKSAFNLVSEETNFEHAASVSYNQQDGRFIFDQSFFEIVAMEDEQR